MDRVVVNVHPFKLLQEVLVFKNQECIDKEEVGMENITETIKKFCTKYNIDHVDLSGTKAYTVSIRDELTDLSKYNKMLNVEIY